MIKFHSFSQLRLINAIFCLLGFLILFVSSCKKEPISSPPPIPSERKVIFVAEASAGCNISTVVYGYDASFTTATGLSGNTWTSPEITAPASAGSVSFSVSASGVNASSSLKLKIFVNGVLKKEATSTGPALSATANYPF